MSDQNQFIGSERKTLTDAPSPAPTSPATEQVVTDHLSIGEVIALVAAWDWT